MRATVTITTAINFALNFLVAVNVVLVAFSEVAVIVTVMVAAAVVLVEEPLLVDPTFESK